VKYLNYSLEIHILQYCCIIFARNQPLLPREINTFCGRILILLEFLSPFLLFTIFSFFPSDFSSTTPLEEKRASLLPSPISSFFLYFFVVLYSFSLSRRQAAVVENKRE
jgi:hypothetical protein